MAWTDSRANINGTRTTMKEVKIALDQRLYARMMLHKINNDEGLSEIVAKAICRYLDVDEKEFVIPSFKEAKERAANSYRKRTDLGTHKHQMEE